MPAKPAEPHLIDMIEAMERISRVIGDMPLEAFESDWQRQWLVERGVQIISEASRRLPDALKARHDGIPWAKVAAIGNVLRHEYHRVSAPILLKLVREDLPELERFCRRELAHEQTAPGEDRP